MRIIMKLSVHWGLQFPVATPDLPVLYTGVSCLFSQRIREAMREWCFLLSGSITAVIKKCISYHRYIPYQLKLFFHKVSFIVNILFSIFMWSAVCRYRKTLCRSVGDTTCAAFQIVVVSKMASSEGVFQGTKKDGVREVLHRNSREDEGDQYTPLSQLPPLVVE